MKYDVVDDFCYKTLKDLLCDLKKIITTQPVSVFSKDHLKKY